MKRRLFIALLAIALLASLLLVWSSWPAGDSAPRYRTGAVEHGPLTAAVTASGNLNAVVSVQVGSQVSGQIAELSADFNTPVRQGQVIARLDPATFASRVAQAEADLAAAESAAEVARGQLALREAEMQKAEIGRAESRRHLERQRALVAQGFLSPAELDNAQSVFDTAEQQVALVRADRGVGQAQLKSALAQVAQRQALVRQARLELERTVIRSPVDGVVVSRSIDVGQTVAASLQAPVLFTIAQDLTRMEVNIAVDEADVGRVAVGQKVSFSVDAFPGRRFAGRVSQIRKAPQVNNNVVTYSVMARVDNPDLALLPGMTANARIVTEERAEVLKVANEALRFRPLQADGTPIKVEVRSREEGPGIPGRVWVLDARGQPQAVPLRLGVSDGKATEILKGEVAAGSLVILGQEDLAKKSNRPFGRAF